MSLWSTPVFRGWWAHYNRFIFPAPNHSLLRARDRFLSRFLPPWEPLFLCLKRARTHSGTCWARGVIYKGFFRYLFFLFYTIFWWEALVEPQIITSRSLTFNILFVICCQTDWLGAALLREGPSYNDFKATQDQRLLKLIIIWIVFKLVTIWITLPRQLFLR